eukprot:15432029-Alexandrium_andersonii.AAC.1
MAGGCRDDSSADVEATSTTCEKEAEVSAAAYLKVGIKGMLNGVSGAVHLVAGPVAALVILGIMLLGVFVHTLASLCVIGLASPLRDEADCEKFVCAECRWLANHRRASDFRRRPRL